MQFHSLLFLFGFLPIFLFVYHRVDVQYRNPTLLVGSLIFYSVIGGGWNLLLMLLLVMVTYIAGRIPEGACQKWIRFSVLGLLLGCLIFFKISSGGQLLPPGLSFVSFQLAAYLISLLRRKTEPQRDILGFFTGHLMFPKVLSGPLMQPQELQDQMKERSLNGDDLHRGMQTFLLGLGIKVLLAEPVGGIWNQAQAAGFEMISAVFAWLALLSFAMELYFNFYGYTVMARGLGRMLGFELPRNFTVPYRAQSVSEFYRRWHQSLGLWFRDNVYIPLGGNREGKWRTARNILIVWILSGLWHGISLAFVLWGLFLGSVIVVEHCYLGEYLAQHKRLAHGYMLAAIMLSWVIFASSGIVEAKELYSSLFSAKELQNMDYLFIFEDYFIILLVGVAAVFEDVEHYWQKLAQEPLADWVMLGIFWVCVYRISTSAQDPFAYFRF